MQILQISLGVFRVRMEGILGNMMVIWVVFGHYWLVLSPKSVFLSSRDALESGRERLSTVKYAVEADFPDFAGGVSGVNEGYFG